MWQMTRFIRHIYGEHKNAGGVAALWGRTKYFSTTVLKVYNESKLE